MYHKVKNTLAGLAMVAAFVAGGAVLGEPMPAPAAPQASPAAPAGAEAKAVLTAVHVALALASQDGLRAAANAEELAERAEQQRARAARLRLELGMPTYSFGAMLPRRGES